MGKQIEILLNPKLDAFFNEEDTSSIIKWGDDFSKGPLIKEMGSDEFWMKRYAFAEEKYKQSHIQYFDSTIKPIVSLEDLEGVSEVTLWSDNTLQSQLNLLTVGSYLLDSYRKDVYFFIVNLKNDLLNIDIRNEININKIREEHRVKITRNNFLFLHNNWINFVNNSGKNIQITNFEHIKFPFLKTQISTYIKQHDNLRRSDYED